MQRNLVIPVENIISIGPEKPSPLDDKKRRRRGSFIPNIVVIALFALTPLPFLAQNAGETGLISQGGKE